MIPDFSLPGTSAGTKEADKYLKQREKGISQKKAAQIFTALGMNQNYGISLEKKFKIANRKAFVLFPEDNDLLHNPLLLFRNDETAESAIVKINRQYLETGYNPLYFSRNNILRIREIK